MSKNSNQLQALECLFDSKLRIKVLKFLFRNYPMDIGARELAKRIQEPVDAVKKEMAGLNKIGLVNKV